MSAQVKETKEVLLAAIELMKIIAKELKDGFQVADLVNAFVAIQGDEVKKAKIEAALQNISDVPAELKDVSLAESIELAVAVLAELPSMIEAFKKA